MADPTGQEPTASGQAPQSQTSAETPASPERAETFDAEYVRKLRAEAAEHRTKLREFEAAHKAAEDAKLSEQERLTKRLSELEAQQTTWQRERQELTTRYAIEREAQRLGVVDPDAAYRLLDLAKVEYDDDGSPKDVAKHLQELVRARPYLAGPAQAAPASSGAATNPAHAGGRSSGTFTTSQIADRAFWVANKDAILRAMAEGRIVQG